MTNLPGGGPRTRQDMDMPSLYDFDMLKETVLEIGDLPDATAKPIDDWRLFVNLERPFYEPKEDLLPRIVHFGGILSVRRAGTNMVMRYQEFSLNYLTKNAGFTHDYILKKEGDEVVEFGHSMRASPQIAEPRQNPWESSTLLDRASEGRRILKTNTGNQLELMSGDCGVLYDRLLALMAA